MSAKKWNFYYDEKKRVFTINRLVDAISLWIAIGLLWMSFFCIMEEHFPQFLEIDWWVAILFLVCMWLPTSGFLFQKSARGTVVFSVAAMLIPVVYIVHNFDKMPEGVLEIASDYLYKFNPYQGTNLSVPSGNTDYVPIAFTALLMILWMAVWGIARFVKRPVVLVLFPLTALLLEFMVGLSPEEDGMFYLFVAGMLLLVPNGTKPLRQGVIVGITVLSLFLAGELFDEEIYVLSEGKDKVFSWIEYFEVPTFEWENGLQFDFITNNEQVNNNRPNFTGEKVFEIKANNQPFTSIYLRGFCGTDYVNGTWKWDKSIFQEACKKAGYSEQESARILAGFPYAVLAASEVYTDMDVKMELTYVSSAGNTAYVPYVFEDGSIGKDYIYSADYLIKKDIWNKKISFTGSAAGDMKALSYYTYYAKYVDGYDTMQWYNQVAAEYAKSTNSMECIKSGADFVSTWVDYPTEEDLWLIMYDNEMQDVLLENMYRMEVATWVRSYLAYNMRYSLILDNLPAGADPVEYALTEGKEGYCMHYASAAALIFKELGVPARYVSGYIVRPSDFVWNADAACYLAEVEDYNSHAWVEIYLDNIGWVPIEVTEGYEDDSDMLPTERDPQEPETEEPTESEVESESETEKEKETESESELPTESEVESESETETKTDSESEKDTQSESEGDTENTEGTGDGQGVDGNNTRDVWKEVMSFAMIVVAAVAAIYGVKVLLARYEYVLEQEIKRNQTRRAVKRINKRIYRILRLTKPFTGQFTDAQYERLLVETYTKVSKEEWAYYMEIVKKMHYSLERITHEEMMHCYWCYKNFARG